MDILEQDRRGISTGALTFTLFFRYLESLHKTIEAKVSLKPPFCRFGIILHTPYTHHSFYFFFSFTPSSQQPRLGCKEYHSFPGVPAEKVENFVEEKTGFARLKGLFYTKVRFNTERRNGE